MKKYYQLSQEKTDISIYKQWLKKISDINIRRSSKFNILAIYGALKCMDNIHFSQRLGIYLLTRYGPVSNVVNVLDKHQAKQKITPFDFLNINSNNAAFYVARALNATGKNMVLTTTNNSLADGIKLAQLDMTLNIIDDALVGLVDESVDGILTETSLDTSQWIYFSNKYAHCQAEQIIS